MKRDDFENVPVGTALVTSANDIIYFVKVKIDANTLLTVVDILCEQFDNVGNVLDVRDYNYLDVDLAPDWIQNLCGVMFNKNIK